MSNISSIGWRQKYSLIVSVIFFYVARQGHFEENVFVDRSDDRHRTVWDQTWEDEDDYVKEPTSCKIFNYEVRTLFLYDTGTP